jgi:hypothetical protein
VLRRAKRPTENLRAATFALQPDEEGGGYAADWISTPITNLFDHNRDGLLTSADYAIVQANFFQTLLLLTAPL